VVVSSSDLCSDLMDHIATGAGHKRSRLSVKQRIMEFFEGFDLEFDSVADLRVPICDSLVSRQRV